MVNLRCDVYDDSLTVYLRGQIDSGNSAKIEQAIYDLIDAHDIKSITYDMGQLEYISSAGLRVILRTGKRLQQQVSIINVPASVYDVLDMTGFTQMFEVTKAYRSISVDGCEVVGRGVSGVVYRIDPDTVVKVYYNPDSLSDIKRERDLAREAFVQGVPTAIPYDVVRVGESYGSVFELLDARSLASLLAAGEMSVEQVAQKSVDLLKLIHSTEASTRVVPDQRLVAYEWVDALHGHLSEEFIDKLRYLLESMPENHHLVHGDFHIKNVMVQNDELLLIDMDTLSYGHPVFEFAFIFGIYVGFGELDPSIIENFLGLPIELAHQLWDRMLHLYLGNVDEATVRSVEEKAMVLGYARIIRREIRLQNDDGMINLACRHLEELLPKMDTLLF